MKKWIENSSLFLTVISTGSTLICCAIPALLVLLGAGSTVVALVGIFPQLVWLSEHKNWVFGLGFLLLSSSYYFSVSTPISCPSDPVLAEACRRTKHWTRIVWGISAVLYGTGFVVAFVLPLW